MRLVGSRVAFGRHETFPLRFSWLPKGVQALEKNYRALDSPDSTVTLGVGKNMVNAIRYWMRACRMVKGDSFDFTELGKLVLSTDGFDPYLEDEGTIWLLHWLVASNAELATSFFWFFNSFHKREFSTEELNVALNDFLVDEVPANRRPAKSTTKSDVSVILRMYSQSKVLHRMPLEDVLDSPFSLLKLVEHKASDRIFVSRLEERQNLPLEVLGFALLEIFAAGDVSVRPIEELMYSSKNLAAPGSVFRLTEGGFVKKVELLTEKYPTIFEIRESSGVNQLYLLDRKVKPHYLIQCLFGLKGERSAA